MLSKLKEMPIFSNKKMLWIIISLVLVSVVGVWIFASNAADAADAAEEPPLQTSKVRTGDLVVSANGGGNVFPAAQADLSFRSSGILQELNVVVGAEVSEGQVLARLEDSVQLAQLAQAEAAFEGLFSPSGIAQAKITLANAQLAFQENVDELKYFIGGEVYYWEVEVEKASVELITLQADNQASDEQIATAESALERAQGRLAAAQYTYRADYVPEAFAATYTDLETGDTVDTIIPPSETDITLARANVETARFAMLDAEAVLEILQAGSAAVTGPVIAVQGAESAKIEQARLALENAQLSLENTRLTAPFSGVIISLNAVVGQTVNTSPIMTLATTDDLRVRLYMDETDMDNATVGNKTLITFDAFPDVVINGEIIAVEQALQTVDGTPVIVSWVAFENEENLSILSGMTVDVEIIGGEALGALLVPIQALREIAPGSYAVFVVDADGSLKLTPVTVGLRDFANAEIVSGLKAGDIVSTGIVETK